MYICIYAGTLTLAVRQINNLSKDSQTKRSVDAVAMVSMAAGSHAKDAKNILVCHTKSKPSKVPCRHHTHMSITHIDVHPPTLRVVKAAVELRSLQITIPRPPIPPRHKLLGQHCAANLLPDPSSKPIPDPVMPLHYSPSLLAFPSVVAPGVQLLSTLPSGVRADMLTMTAGLRHNN